MIQKPTFYVVLATLILISSVVFAQDRKFDPNPIRDVIKTGNSKEVARYLNQSVDISLDEDGGVSKSYSKAQAELILKDFFKKHPPTDFVVVHNGASAGGLHFTLATYKSSAETYDVTIRVRQVGDQFLIHEMMFTKE